MFRLAPTALAIALLASPAFAFWAKNGMEVTPVDRESFTVQYKSVRDEHQYLCAAGDYVIRALGMSTRTRLYRQSPGPRKRGQGITFTLDEAKKTDMQLISSFSKNKWDGGLSAGDARGNYCVMIPIFDNF